MNYAAARPKIRSGDLLAWSHERWGSWYDFKVQMVRMFTRSEYCHVGLAWVIGGRVFALEAVQPMVRTFPLRKLAPFYWIPLGARWAAATEEFALERVGDPYSEAQAVLAGLGRLKIGADRIQQCAEYVLAVLHTDGVGLDLRTRATPSGVVRAAQALDKALYFVEAG